MEKMTLHVQNGSRSIFCHACYWYVADQSTEQAANRLAMAARFFLTIKSVISKDENFAIPLTFAFTTLIYALIGHAEPTARLISLLRVVNGGVDEQETTATVGNLRCESSRCGLYLAHRLRASWVARRR